MSGGSLNYVADSLADRYVVPPFTVLDQRQGYWQARRRQWLNLGIQSELGRGSDAQQRSTPEVRAGSVMAQGWTKRADGSVSPEGEDKPYAGRVRPVGLLSGGTERTEQRVIADAGLLFDEVIQRRVGVMDGKYDTEKGENAYGGMGTSIFDPVLCELVYRWWAPPGGSVLDPFAGGSVRGIVAAMLGHPYTGIDLSLAQCRANEDQARRIVPYDQPMPRWIVGDSHEALHQLEPEAYDLVFSCPPYYDLEVYSDDPADLSNLPTYGAFVQRYREIIELAASRLRDRRHFVLVVSEVRGKDGRYIGLVPDTIRALQLAGLGFYNEAIIVNSIGTLPLRVARYFESGRKLGRSHQNLIGAIKGEPERGWDAAREFEAPDPQTSMWAEAEPPPELSLLEEEL